MQPLMITSCFFSFLTLNGQLFLYTLDEVKTHETSSPKNGVLEFVLTQFNPNKNRQTMAFTGIFCLNSAVLNCLVFRIMIVYEDRKRNSNKISYLWSHKQLYRFIATETNKTCNSFRSINFMSMKL